MFTRITLTALALASLSAGLAQTIKTVPPTPTNPTSGPEMYKQYCAVCHGPDGKGGGPAATALKKAPADLTQLSAHNKGKFPDARVARYIEGDEKVAAHGSSEMPMWGVVFKSMSGNEDVVRMRVSNLTDYIKGMQAK
ncbi:MAG TPA: c-type cytochrome [Bryobacteraceae bacterium]|nr:c-type cytochrome [Bryobacteraceae bacterium]